ncbi:MAG TPA: aspartate dehydrogenase domain-containing protein [Candidatus Limnocylindrales bacterium]|nr:aspartate dehydrogenase domain-containing protein [Candidatus Limnocylindrales bacterium]
MADERADERERILFIGFGRLAEPIAKAVRATWPDEVRIVGAVVLDPTIPSDAADALGLPLLADVRAALPLAPTLAIELAGPAAVREHVPALLGAGVDVVVTSVVALGEGELCETLAEAARRGGAKVLVPPGAIAGLDGIGAATYIGLESVTHRIRKPPASLLHADEAARVVASGQAEQLFAGPAAEAILRFPGSVNVAAALSLAGLGFDRTRVEVVADPAVEQNIHRIEAEGAFGRIEVGLDNVRVPGATSGALVVGSVLRSVGRRLAPIVVD